MNLIQLCNVFRNACKSKDSFRVRLSTDSNSGRNLNGLLNFCALKHVCTCCYTCDCDNNTSLSQSKPNTFDSTGKVPSSHRSTTHTHTHIHTHTHTHTHTHSKCGNCTHHSCKHLCAISLSHRSELAHILLRNTVVRMANSVQNTVPTVKGIKYADNNFWIALS